MVTVTDRRPLPTSSPLALLFTDARGRIVFVDNNFLDLLDVPEAAALVGSPLHQYTGVEAAEITRLMQDVARAGYIHERPLKLCCPGGSPVEVLCSSVATYNERGEFIGADMTLTSAEEATELDEEAEAPAHGDVLLTRIQQIHDEAEARQEAEDTIFLQLYFTAQLNALQVLLARMGGPRIYEALEKTLNETAAKQKWQVRVHSGQIILDQGQLPPEAYRLLLRAVMDYATNVIGRSALLREMRMVDGHMDARTLGVADEAGLRALIT